MMKLDTSELDGLTKMMASMPGVNQRARNSALGSVGFGLKAKAKASVSSNAFGWPQVSSLTQQTKAFPASSSPNRMSSRDIVQSALLTKSTKKVWGSLAPLLVYSLEKDQGVLFFGFAAGTFGKRYAYTRSTGERVRRDNYIGQSVVLLAEKLTNGFEYAITSKDQQRYFAALGFPFKIGRVLRIPARPLVGPTFIAFRPEIPALFSEKFWASMRRNTFPDEVRVAKSLWGKVAA